MDQAEQLRNIIKQQSPPRTKFSRVITVTSGKGGVGKTSLAVNMALQFQRQGKKVVILDADFGLANIEVMLGIRPQYNLADLMFNGKALKDIITEGPEGIGFISGGSGIKELASLSREQIIMVMEALSELDKLVDVIIVDTGAGIADNVLEFAAASEEVLLVVTPEPTSITDAYALLKTLNHTQDFQASQTVIKLISNRVQSEKEGQEIFDKVSLVADKFLNIQLEYLGFVLNDANVSKAVMHQKPLIQVYPNTPAALSMLYLANKLQNNEHTIMYREKGIKRLFTNLIHAKIKRW
ncbi:MAG: MinD/ParA family protein [Lachnospiraceae bacterium]|nr:MinD/ParA family protein [Lachnospiraceae bacterium]